MHLQSVSRSDLTQRRKTAPVCAVIQPEPEFSGSGLDHSRALRGRFAGRG